MFQRNLNWWNNLSLDQSLSDEVNDNYVKAEQLLQKITAILPTVGQEEGNGFVDQDPRTIVHRMPVILAPSAKEKRKSK